jgi:seryl-tRNA(Sec) selenium transferase
MRKILQRPLRRRKATLTATEDALEEVEQQGHEEDTDTTNRDGGVGDPISPSPEANKDAVGEDHSG